MIIRRLTLAAILGICLHIPSDSAKLPYVENRVTLEKSIKAEPQKRHANSLMPYIRKNNGFFDVDRFSVRLSPLNRFSFSMSMKEWAKDKYSYLSVTWWRFPECSDEKDLRKGQHMYFCLNVEDKDSKPVVIRYSDFNCDNHFEEYFSHIAVGTEGLSDATILGSGDAYFAYALDIFNRSVLEKSGKTLDELIRHWLKYRDKL